MEKTEEILMDKQPVMAEKAEEGWYIFVFIGHELSLFKI